MMIIGDDSMQPLVLCILDGVGIREDHHGNAFYQARTPHFDYLWNRYPHTLIEASGPLVGLPVGQMGNSEVGHMNIGAGRIVYQPLEMINQAIMKRNFYDNQALIEIMEYVKQRQSKLHLCGLVSDGGIHSHINHLFACLELAKQQGVDQVYIHAFLDGRDTLPSVADTFIEQLETKMTELGIGKIATIAGRYYAMDRDNRWDRVCKAYKNMTQGSGPVITDIKETLKQGYEQGIGDEFVEPMVVDSEGLIQDHDGIICFNFRPDRLRELFSAFTNPTFSGFERTMLSDISLVTMMPVSDEVICSNAYPLQELDNTLGEYLSKQGKTQLRIAETEKYAHVTYFFDGGEEHEWPGAKRILIPSPKVATYDLKPSMSAYEITDVLQQELMTGAYDVVILNYANGDMVGHTGDFAATMKAMETVDACLGKLYQIVESLHGTLVVLADHGNCDKMLDHENNIITSHTTSKVPFIITRDHITLQEGKLGDVAPTLLALLGMEIPNEMTGNNLIQGE
jgi:2,3-bisphosphoglycerate-independent phosphoglycerate mutase